MRAPGPVLGLASIVWMACASSPWDDAGLDEERTFWVDYDRLHGVALAVVRELGPESLRVHPTRDTIHAEGALGRCGEHAHCARRTPGAGAVRLWTRLRIDFSRSRTFTEIDVVADHESVGCRRAAAADCQRIGVPSTGELEEEILRRIRARLGTGP